jgi:hypothetical protein
MNSVRLYAALLVALVIGISLVGGATAAPTPPTIDTKPPQDTNQTDADFTFSDTDPTVVLLESRLDNEAFLPCITPQPCARHYTNLDPKQHTFEVRATDAMAQTSGTQYTWTIDKSAPPKPTIDAKPQDPSTDRSPTFRFSDTKDKVTFQCDLDSNGFADCDSPKTYTQQPDGSHTFSVRAIDKAGNMSASASYTWRIDRTPPPAPTIGSAPANPTTETGASFSFSDSEAGVTFECQLDGATFSSCSSPATYSGLTVITHAFSVRATDLAGNTGAVTSYGWTINAPADTKAPDTTAPGDVRSLNRKVGYGILKLTWSRPPDADFNYVRVFVAKGAKAAKGGPLRTSVYKGTGTRYTNKRFKNGTYYRYAIVTYDKAGNASRGMAVVVRPSALLRSPAAGRVVHAAPRLVWARVAKASFYNVQLYFRGQKVLSAWPSAARLGLTRSWSYANRGFKLKKGTYAWYVWPGFGPRSKSRYGQLLGQSSFTVR